MIEHSDSVMICLLPISSEWSRTEPAHLTLVYGGSIEDRKITDFNDMAKDVASISMLSNPIAAKVTGTAVFGEEEKVNVLTIESTQELLSMRRILEKWDVSDFDFNPHATIGPLGTPVENVPLMLIFDRISVWWGDQPVTFWLKKY